MLRDRTPEKHMVGSYAGISMITTPPKQKEINLKKEKKGKEGRKKEQHKWLCTNAQSEFLQPVLALWRLLTLYNTTHHLLRAFAADRLI